MTQVFVLFRCHFAVYLAHSVRSPRMPLEGTLLLLSAAICVYLSVYLCYVFSFSAPEMKTTVPKRGDSCKGLRLTFLSFLCIQKVVHLFRNKAIYIYIFCKIILGQTICWRLFFFAGSVPFHILFTLVHFKDERGSSVQVIRRDLQRFPKKNCLKMRVRAKKNKRMRSFLCFCSFALVAFFFTNEWLPLEVWCNYQHRIVRQRRGAIIM